MKDRSSLARSLTLAATGIGFGVVQLDVTIVNTALKAIGSSLGGGVTELQWVVSAYTISFAALILTAGALGDRLGARKVFMAGFATFTAASLAAALAPNAAWLIAARAAQGLGAALLVPNSLALLNHAFTEAGSRNRAVGIWAASASVALALGPVVGGGLIALVGWRSIFLVNLPIGLAGLWLAWRYADETAASAKRRLDLPGQLAAVGTLGCLAGAIIEGGVLGWGSPWVVGGFVVSAVAAVLFVVQERHHAQPMLPLSLFERPLFAFTSAVGLLANVAFYGLIFLFSLYFQQVQNYSPLETGLAFLPMVGAILPLNLIAARVAERIGGTTTIAIGAAISALGCLALLGIDARTSYHVLWLPLFALGAGLGLLVPPLTSTLLASVDKTRSGVAAGALNAARQTGSVIGVALFGSLVGRGDRFIAGTHEAIVISAALLFLAAAAIVIGGRLEGRGRR
jgi:DHA2 family methylenomycin A resistance protein-like MFS transporter